MEHLVRPPLDVDFSASGSAKTTPRTDADDDDALEGLTLDSLKVMQPAAAAGTNFTTNSIMEAQRCRGYLVFLGFIALSCACLH